MAGSETRQATQLLQAQRAQDRDEQTFGWLRNRFSSQAGTEFSHREINKLLTEVVESDGSVGVVKALLSLGADINFVRRRNSTTWNKIAQRHHQNERSDILLRATIKCRPETVHALAAHADQQNLDSVLHHAIARGNLAIIRTLLDHGASPVYLHDDFQGAVFRDNVDLIEVLLSGHHLPCLACRSTGLRLAVANGSVDVIRLLLNHWADVNYGEGIALIRAVEDSRPDLVAALISGPVKPSPRTLDTTVSRAQGSTNTVNAFGYEIVGMCLAAGAAGPATTHLITDGMIETIRRRDIQLLETIVQHRRVPEDYEGFCLVEAIRTGQVDVLAKLLELRPSSQSLTVAVSQAMKVNDSDERYGIVDRLIEGGAQGLCVAEALINITHSLVSDSKRGDSAARDRDFCMFNLILHDGKADVNYRKGEALQVAVRSSCTDIAEQIVAQEPSAESLGAALGWAMGVDDVAQKQHLVEILARHPIDEVSSGKALVEVFKNDSDNTELIQLLLTRASVNYNNGEVFIYATRNFRSETFHLVLSQGISYKALFTLLMEALRAPRTERKAILEEVISRFQLDHLNMALKHVVLEPKPDLVLAKTLLDSGAEPTHDNGVCIKNAACNLERDLLHLLSGYAGKNVELFTQAFAAILSRGKQWIAFEHVDTIRILLKHGASPQTASRAMMDIVDHLACNDDQAALSRALLDSLFAAGADVNYENGKAVGMAASRGDPSLLDYLLKQKADTTSATLALSAAIMAHHPESLLLEILNVMAQPGLPTDFNHSLPGMPHPPIILILKSYGDSVAIVHRLVRAGCRLDSTVLAVCDTDKGSQAEVEPVTVLMWALLQKDEMISTAVIEALICHGSDLTYTTPVSQTTPFLIAVRSGRVDVVEMLLSYGAKVNVKDNIGRSPLFFASRAGDVAMMATLLKHSPSVNDGSLHEAARNFHPEAIKMLLDAGHDANYRSTKHGGRTALGEVALRAVVPHDIAVADESLDILASVDASPLLKVRGKTVIFLALDNQNNEAIARVLLDRLLYKTLNSHENTYQEGNYHYSPTMYITKGILLGPRSPALIQMLQNHGVEDRYYASIEETQPPDAVGLPEEIRDYERERRAWEQRNRRMEESHGNEIRRVTERAQVHERLEDQKHNRSVRYRDAHSQQRRKERSLDHHQATFLQAEKHHTDSQIRISESNVQSGIRWQKHNDSLAMANQQRSASLAHRQQVHVQHIEERKQKNNMTLEYRDLRHAKSLTHMQDIHSQRWGETEKFNYQQLQFESQRKTQNAGHSQRQRDLNLEAYAARNQLDAESARTRHDMNMTELKTQRNNIIGQVNLEELRRWQQQTNMLPAQQQGQGMARRLLA
ncbi:ankyrin repeat-containing domain protein [Triangularia verruculosa]|uniref:Ankyrin repeat-containing domain protein n=1 Tax=Triangularia verruculosa TaxID=2587418 RepID=A0AAN6XKK3_9PEZI|nr:ankyrin repeat-containing domain protein [Triangularia verruculosa]